MFRFSAGLLSLLCLEAALGCASPSASPGGARPSGDTGTAPLPAGAPSAAPSPAPSAGPAAPSQAAWQPLFDGKSLAGWKKTDFGGSLDAQVEDGKLLLPLGEPMTGVTWTGDFPRTGYEIELEAQRVDGQDFFCGLTFPAGEGHASLILGGWGGGVSGISCINGRDASENETMFYRQFEKGKWYAVKLRVTREAIEVWLDGDVIVDLDTTGKKIDVRADIRLATPLGLSTWRTAAALRNLRWRRVEA